jgi:hypothetical protein
MILKFDKKECKKSPVVNDTDVTGYTKPPEHYDGFVKVHPPLNGFEPAHPILDGFEEK